MKNLFKKSKVLFLVLLLILSIGILVACNSDSTQPAKTPADTATIETEEPEVTEVAIIDSLDGIYDTSQQINDCSADCEFTIESETELDSDNLGDFISVTDRNGNSVGIEVISDGFGFTELSKRTVCT